MQIRGKLLLLLLVIALVPLGFSAVLNQLALRRLGDRLTADTRQFLEQTSRHFLHSKVEDYRSILQRDRQTMHLALDYQAREVEQRVAAAIVGRRVGEDEAPAICIGRWATFADEVWSKLPKKSK